MGSVNRLLFLAFLSLVTLHGSNGSIAGTPEELRSYLEQQGVAWKDIMRGLSAESGRSRKLTGTPDFPALTVFGGASMEQLVPDGYPFEKHKVVTDDGWILNMYRIPYGKYRNNKPGKRPVILLHHGITLSSASFALYNANETLAYICADAGIDVWMANTRSNTFSRGNLKYSYRDIEYWYHTIDQYALIDLPAQVDKALEVSGASKLAFVGHSQGSSVIHASLASLPEMNKKVSVVFHMGPVVFLDFFRAPFLRAYGEVRNDLFFRNAEVGEFLWQRFLAPYVQTCWDYKWAELCASTLNQMFYGPSMFVTPDDFQVILQTWPNSVSARNIMHWAQMLTDGQLRFQMFDYGTNCTNRTRWSETCNQQVYGSMMPPEYDLSKITVPQVMLEGELDIMSVPEDVKEQIKRLKNALIIELVYEKYGHMDYVWDRNMRHAVDVVDLTYRFGQGTF